MSAELGLENRARGCSRVRCIVVLVRVHSIPLVVNMPYVPRCQGLPSSSDLVSQVLASLDLAASFVCRATDWWRSELERTGKRPGVDSVCGWYDANAGTVASTATQCP